MSQRSKSAINFQNGWQFTGSINVICNFFNIIIRPISLTRKHLSGAEYQNYGRQYQTFQKILAVYDTEPDNFPRYN